MGAITTPVGVPGIQYVRGRLRQGLALSRAVANRIDGLNADALTVGAGPAEKLLQFDYGGFGSSVVGILPAWLKNCFKDGIMIVELPLWRPVDRVSTDDRLETVVADGDVYAACSLSDELDKIDATIRSADPAYMYHAMIFRDHSSLELVMRSAGWRDGLAEGLVAVLVGAYDGEGFVLCRRAGIADPWG